MKIFVSGQVNDIDNVQIVLKKLTAAGHTITYDWTQYDQGDQVLATKEDKLHNPTESARRAEMDIQGVMACDVYVMCANNAPSGRGMHVELGAALARRTTTSLPLIFIIGPENDSSIFYFHKNVERLDAIEDVLRHLN